MKTHLVFRQYVWLLETLRRYSKLSLDEINDLWLRNEMSEGQPMARSTFNYHRRNIEEMFDINIECDSKDGYRYYIENGDSLDANNVQNYLLETLSVSNALSQTKDIRNRIVLEKIPMGQQYLSSIVKALKENIVISIQYQAFRRDVPSKPFLIEPYCLKVFSQRWYILARHATHNTELDQDFVDDFDYSLRVFALDRIASLELTDENFLFYSKFSPDDFFRYSYGIYTSHIEEAREIVVRVYGEDREYLRTCPIHDSQEEVMATSGYTDYKFFLKPTYDFVQKLLSYGANIEVRLPLDFRNVFHQSALDSVEIYEGR